LIDLSLPWQGMEASFIEVIAVGNCLSLKIAQPRTHQFDMTVEARVKGSSFADCIVLFLRRVVEEAYNVQQCTTVMHSNIKAVMNERSGSVQTIDIKTIKERREQVLTILVRQRI
jgi:hypothetical protein